MDTLKNTNLFLNKLGWAEALVHIGRDVITRSANPVTPSCFTGLSSAHAQWHVNNSIRGGLFLCRTGSLNRRFAGLYLQKNLINICYVCESTTPKRIQR